MTHHPIAPDIIQVQLPLPFALRIVNAYLLRDDGGWAVIDTGLHTDEGEAAWRAAFDALAIRPGDLTQIVVTHHHPDHYGMAGWLCAWNGRDIPVHIMARELAMIQQVWWRETGQREEFTALSHLAGVDDAMLESFLHISAEIRARTRPQPSDIRTLHDGDHLRIGARDLRIIEAPGHSVGQALLYDEADALLFSADHVLLKITPNVGLWPGADADPLARFIDSITTLRDLPVRLALPGHKALIEDWRGRIDELLHHHDERLAHIRAAAHGKTAMDVALAIFPFERFSPHEQRFAVAEALAHLEHLRLRGDLRRENVADGAWVYGE
jgi:glyoxylase-like metal-dependent hydrolase (beta-lactamase superfamily II)